jgi:hypothetical protein
LKLKLPRLRSNKNKALKTDRLSGRLLCLDIETKPAQAFVWGLYDQNISLDQLISPSAPICVAAKFIGEPQKYFFADWIQGHKEMIEGIHKLISEADAVVTYNGDKFDLTKLRGEFLLAGLQPPPPVASIDLLKTIKKFGLQSGKLAYVAPLLGVSEKVKHEGFSLWVKVMNGDKEAQQRMQEYCEGDIPPLEEMYMLLRPYIVNHPFLGTEGKNGACPTCNCVEIQRRGFRRTKAFLIQRLQCTSCGHWFDGTKKKVK